MSTRSLSTRSLALALSSAALALAAVASPARAEAPACTGTLSGAVTATFKCTVAVRDLGDGSAVIDVQQAEEVDGVGSFGVGSWILPKGPAKGSHPFDALGMGKSSLILQKDGALFTATRTTRARGDVSLELTSVEKRKAPPGTYAVHGTFRARLLPIANARTDEVVVTVKF